MYVYVVTMGRYDTFYSLEMSEEAARDICLDRELDLSWQAIHIDSDDLQRLVHDETVAHCFSCDIPLIKSEVRFKYGDDECKYNYCFCSYCL